MPDTLTSRGKGGGKEGTSNMLGEGKIGDEAK